MSSGREQNLGIDPKFVELTVGVVILFSYGGLFRRMRP